MSKLPFFTTEHLKDLAGALLKTQPVELTCDEWLDEIAPYAEALLNNKEPRNAAAIEHHLDICPECKEEFDALMTLLRGT
jgi:hypothetical protein